MAPIAEIEQRLAAYRQAELEVLSNGQSYELPGPDGLRKFTRADLEKIQRMIKLLEQDLSEAQARSQGRPRRRSLVPMP